MLQISMVLDPCFKTQFISQEEIAEIKKIIIEKCLESWTEWYSYSNTRTGRTSYAANSVLPLDIPNPNKLTQKKKTGLSAIFDESINNKVGILK